MSIQKTPGGGYYVEGQHGQPGRTFPKLAAAQAYDQELERFGRVCEVKPALALLIELYEDVQRWRDDQDARSLHYILETVEKIDPADVEALKVKE